MMQSMPELRLVPSSSPPWKMKESRDGIKSDKCAKNSSVSSLPLILDIDDFKGEFSFDALFGNLVNDLLPSFQEDETDSSEGHSNVSGTDSLPNGHMRAPSDATRFAQGVSDPLFPEVDKILSLFKDSCKELVDLQPQIDGKLLNLKKDVSVQDSKHRKTLTEIISGKYPFWNRTHGTDHFLVACHDWGPYTLTQHEELANNTIKALCNADTSEGVFVAGKDVSLPETNIRNPRVPLRNIGGLRVSQRPLLAFFAGRMK